MVTIVCVGKLDKTDKEKIAFYQKQMRDLSFIIKELPHGSAHNSIADEEKGLLAAFKSDNFNVALDEIGQHFSSENFSKLLFKQTKNITFFIGGAYGLPKSIREKCDLILSFSSMTWPHAFARVMLVEQIYRAEKIKQNHPYHK